MVSIVTRSNLCPQGLLVAGDPLANVHLVDGLAKNFVAT